MLDARQERAGRAILISCSLRRSAPIALLSLSSLLTKHHDQAQYCFLSGSRSWRSCGRLANGHGRSGMFKILLLVWRRTSHRLS